MTIDDFDDEEAFATFGGGGGGEASFVTFEIGPLCFPLLIKIRALFKLAFTGPEGVVSVMGLRAFLFGPLFY